MTIASVGPSTASLTLTSRPGAQGRRPRCAQFDVSLDQLHNDSTTITFHGDYDSAERERTLRGRLRLAVTWGHNKDHRPDLKQLLYILTVTGDGAVRCSSVESGNATDDRTHQGTWELLCQLTGRRDFLYIADCKLATTENMAYLHQRGGRFLSVLPRTRGEDAAFRVAVLARVSWRRITTSSTTRGSWSTASPSLTCRPNDRRLSVDLVSQPPEGRAGCGGPADTAGEGAQAAGRTASKLASPRTRYRRRAKVAEAVEEVLQNCDVTEWIATQIQRGHGEVSPGASRAAGEEDAVHRGKKVRFKLKLGSRCRGGRGGPLQRDLPTGQQRSRND